MSPNPSKTGVGTEFSGVGAIVRASRAAQPQLPNDELCVAFDDGSGAASSDVERICVREEEDSRCHDTTLTTDPGCVAGRAISGVLGPQGHVLEVAEQRVSDAQREIRLVGRLPVELCLRADVDPSGEWVVRRWCSVARRKGALREEHERVAELDDVVSLPL